jgi:hypothetical protein
MLYSFFVFSVSPKKNSAICSSLRRGLLDIRVPWHYLISHLLEGGTIPRYWISSKSWSALHKTATCLGYEKQQIINWHTQFLVPHCVPPIILLDTQAFWIIYILEFCVSIIFDDNLQYVKLLLKCQIHAYYIISLCLPFLKHKVTECGSVVFISKATFKMICLKTHRKKVK